MPALISLVHIKNLLVNLALAVLLNALIKPGWIYVEILVQNELGHQQYGRFIALFSLCYVLTAFADLGLNQYAITQIAGDNTFLKERYPVLLGLKAVILGIFPVVMIGVGFALGYTTDALYLLFWTALGVALLQLLQFFRSVLQAGQKFNLDSLLSVLDKALLLAGIPLLIFVGYLTLENYIIARLVTLLVTTLWAYWLVIKFIGNVKPRLVFRQLRLVLISSFPFAIMTLVYGLNEKIDMVLLERLYSEKEAGIYAAAFRWVDAVMMYLWTVLPIFFARFAAHKDQPEEQASLLNTGKVLVALPIIFVSVFALFYAELLFGLFTNSTPAELSAMVLNLQILFLSVLIQGLTAIYSTRLTSSGWAGPVSWLVAFSIGLKVLINVLFVPNYGAVAAAWGTVICTAFLATGYIVLMTLKAKIKVPVSLLIRLIVVAALLAAGVGMCKSFDLHWFISAATGGILLIGLSFLFRLFEWQTILTTLKRRG